MYASVRYYEGIHPDDMDELMRRVDEGFKPIISGQAGFIAYYFFRVDRGAAISVSVFESQAAAEGSNQAAAGWVKDYVAELVPNPPLISVGEVEVYATR